VCPGSRHRASDPGAVEVTPPPTSRSEVRMLVGRWEGQQRGIWGYGRHPYRVFIIDRVGPGDGPTWQADGRCTFHACFYELLTPGV
jgi:hypothetical protein